MIGTSTSRLSRSSTHRGAPPPRMVHLGVGAFHRAHQAWYTAHASDASEWGIVGFTGRTAAVAELLTPQDGLYTLVERGVDGDRYDVVDSLVEVHPADRLDLLCELLARPEVALVTLTVTESAYTRPTDSAADRGLDRLLASTLSAQELQEAGPRLSVLGRLLVALEARRRADAGPVALVPCDNMPDNGQVLGNLLYELSTAGSPELRDWLGSYVDCVSTSVDRITPRTEPELVNAVSQQSQWSDCAPVLTEPFSDWVLSGDFRAGRPNWESAGARFVDDIEPFEKRKLWLLNGAHSFLAAAGQLRGHRTVAEAVADEDLLTRMRGLWSEAQRLLPSNLDVDAYTDALLQRFRNARIEHRLEQIAVDGLRKLQVRIVPVALGGLEAGRFPTASVDAIAAWIAALQSGLAPADESRSDVRDALRDTDAITSLVTLLSADLARETTFVDAVTRTVAEHSVARDTLSRSGEGATQ